MDFKCLFVLLTVFGAGCWAAPGRLSSQELDLLTEHLSAALARARQAAMDKMDGFYREHCDNGADDSARQRLMASYGNFYDCVNLQARDLRDLLQANDTYKFGAQLTCKKYTNSKPCIAKFVRDAKLCQTSTRFPRKAVRSTIYEIIDYICKGDSTRLEGAMREFSPVCAQNIKNEMMPCFDKLHSLQNVTFNAEGCRILNETQECVTDQIKTCGGPKLAEVVDGVTAIGTRRLPCSRLTFRPRPRSRTVRTVDYLPLSPEALLRGPAQFYGAALSPLLPQHPLLMN